jgi:hypothetical protein
METQNYAMQTAADVTKQLITINVIIIAAVLSFLLSNRSSPHHGTALLGVVFGGASVLACLLFLTDIAAHSFGERSKPLTMRRWLFISSWVLFYACATLSAIYFILLPGVA